LHRILPLALSLLAAPVFAETPATLLRLAEPAGLARLVRPAETRDAPLVVMLPDSLGEDGRSEPYVDSLLARGIASLVLGLGEALDAPAAPTDPAASPAAIAPALAWAAAAGIAPARLGVLGFGSGGRAALAGAGDHPAAALYPRCEGLAVAATKALILQGAAAAEACDALALPEDVALRFVPGAGHGWDANGAIWPTPGPMLPDPAGGPRLRATMDLQATLFAAEQVAEWFEEILFGHAQRAHR
jgi:dienelactone hydrolase